MTSFAEQPGMHLQHLVLDTEAAATKEQKIAALKTLRVVVKNLADPAKSVDPKYRQLKLSNQKVKAKLSPCPSALNYMKAIGFDVVDEDGEEYLRVDSSKTIDIPHMKASLNELNNAIGMLEPRDIIPAGFAEEKKTAEAGDQCSATTWSSSVKSSGAAAPVGKFGEKQKARQLMEKKRQRELREAKEARKKTAELIKQDKHVRENDPDWKPKQSAACVKSGSGISSFRDKYGEGE